MGHGEKNFIDSAENMLDMYNQWGKILVEDIKDLSAETSFGKYNSLCKEVKNHCAMASVFRIKPTVDATSYSNINRLLRDKVNSLSDKTVSSNFSNSLNLFGTERSEFE